jgi:uncharacterized protein YdeI (YjbR/CyaY-like superfamily)
MDEKIDVANREDWRKWLAQNHDKKDSIWLIFQKKHPCKRGITLEEAVEEAICFGWIDGKLRKLDEARYMLRFSPRNPKSVWSKINRERAENLIKTGRMAPIGLVTIEQAKLSGSWSSAYTNRVRDAAPADLEEALMKNESAWANFQKFANSYRNMYIGWINAAKTSETRTRRIQKVVDQSRLNQKQFHTTP